MSNPARTEEDITTGLLALIAWAGNAKAASESLASEGKLNIAPATLKSWARDRYPQRYDELREKYSSQLESQIVADMREIVAHALAAQRLAIEQATTMLESGQDKDPGRTAANLSRVSQSNTDKMLSLSGRPTQITENRDVSQLIRGLQASFPQVFPGQDAGEVFGLGDGSEPPSGLADAPED